MAASLAELRAIFCDALDETVAERARFLEQACHGNSELRAEVEALLAAHADAGEMPPDATEAADTVLEPAPVRDGAMIGPYRLIEKIGEGGFGLVFLAEQRQPLQRRVAIKILKQGMDDRQVIARFEAESQALALMEHPNIAHVLDSGFTNGEAGELGSGRPYFVMELCRGIPITEYCKAHGVPLKERLELFISVCLAVQHAHLKGIIHRDLKPSNVLVTMHDDQPVIKLIDFGIAKATGRQLMGSTCTGLAQMIGTPLYMSPEQAQTGGTDIDTRTDIYSLGVLLYELLTAATPFDADRLHEAGYDEMRRIIREEEPPRPSQRLRQDETKGMKADTKGESRPESSLFIQRSSLQELDWIVMKALEKDRTRRYMTAGALAADVRHYLQNEPVLACPPSRWYRFGKLARRHQGALVAAALVVLALVTGTVVSVWQAVRATAAMNAEVQALLDLGEQQLATQRELERTKQAEETATRELFEALVAQARANRLSPRMGQRFGTLEILRKATGIARQLHLPPERFLELRNEALAAMALTDLRVVKEWSGSGGAAIAFDFQLERYASAEADGTVYIRRVGDGAEICRLPGQGHRDCAPLLSPDGRFLALRYPRLRKVAVWQVAAQDPSMILDEKHRDYVAFSRDGRLAGIGGPKGVADIFDLASGTKIQSLQFPGEAVECLEFDLQGRQLAVLYRVLGGGWAPMQVLDLQTGKVLCQQSIAANGPACLAWHPDGRTLAACHRQGDVEAISLWDATTWKQIGLLEGLSGGGLTCEFSHAGILLASNGWEGTLRLWDPLTCRELFRTPRIRCGRFSLDDRFMVTAWDDDKFRILEIAAGGEYRTLTAKPLAGKKRFANSSFSADGRLLAAGADGGFGIWEFSTGKNLLFLNSVLPHFVSLESSEALLTRGPSGLHRWPIRRDPTTGSMHIGVHERLPAGSGGSEFAHSADRKVLVSTAQGWPYVVFADQPGRWVPLRPHADVRYVAVSPDGRWAATGGFGHPGGAKVWEPQTGKLVKDLRVGPFCRVAFSPDGKCLLTGIGNGQIRVWEVGTWTEVVIQEPLRGVAFAFSPDGKLLAAETGAGVARLLDPETGKEYAQLEAPNEHVSLHFTFSPDCTKLVCASGNGHCLHIWDLPALRRQLAAMELDWQP